MKMSKNHASTIQVLMYPASRKIDTKYQNKNKQDIKKMQAENKTKKEEKENNVPAVPYKLKEFKNVESRLTKMLNSRPEDRPHKIQETHSLIKKENTNTISNLRSKSNALTKALKQSQTVLKSKVVKYDQEDENIFGLVKEEDDYPALKKLLDMRKKSQSPDRSLDDYDQIQKIIIKGPTPKSNDINHLAPRINKNYILDNRNKITSGELPKKSNKKDEIDIGIHKNYGKTPEYLQKYKQDQEDKKENLKRKAEESKYPKGTRLLSEDERLETLQSLLNSKKEIITMMEKMPISMKTMAIQNKKLELEKKLDEIEEAVRTFSRKQVFIKAEF